MNTYLNEMFPFAHNTADVDDEMASTVKRLETFKGWPESSQIKPVDLVNAGFYYTGFGDEVRCFSCNLQLKEWKLGDDPFEEHRRRKADCNFVTEYERERLGVTCYPKPASEPTGSVGVEGSSLRNPYLSYNSTTNYQSTFRNYPGPLHTTQHQDYPYQTTYNQNTPGVFVTSQQSQPVLQTPEHFATRPSYSPMQAQGSTLRTPTMSYTEIGRQGYPMMPGTEPSMNYAGMIRPGYSMIPATNQSSIVQRPYERFLERNVDIPVVNPVLQHVPNVQVRTEDIHHTTSQTDLQSNNHRLATFIDWPEDCPVHPWELAAAGFFYMGTGDNVKCYKCKVALRNWEPDDTPWEEHKRWSPDCPLVKEHEGHASIPVEDQEQPTETPYQRTTNVPLRHKQFAYPQSTYQQLNQSQLTHQQLNQSQSTHQQLNQSQSTHQHLNQSQSTHQHLNQSQSTHHQLNQSQSAHQQFDQSQLTHQHLNQSQSAHQQLNQSQSPYQQLNQSQSPYQQLHRINHPQLQQPFRMPVIPSGNQPSNGLWGKHPNEVENQQPFYVTRAETSAFAASTQTSTSITTRPTTNSVAASPMATTVTSTAGGRDDNSLDARDFTRVIEMGFTRQDIDNAIARQTERTGQGFAKLDDLMQALLDDNQTTQSSSPLPGTNHAESHQRNEGVRGQTEAFQPQLTTAQSFSFESNNLCVKRALKRSNSAPPTASPSTPSEQGHRDLEKTQEERLICKICMDAEVGVVFIPCGHISCCPHCASGLELCPMCRKPIKQMVRTFLS